MAYSNGFEQSTVISSLKDRVGFRQPLGSGVPTLSSAVTTSASGRYFQDFHALVSVQNIKATMEQVGASDANLITYLSDIRQAAIMRALNGVFSGPQVIDQPALLFKRLGRDDVAEANSNLFVGYEINVADEHDAAVQIDAISVLMDGAATFNVYLFKDGDPTALWSQSVTSIAGKIVSVDLTGKVLNRGKYWLGFFQADLGSVKAYRQQVADETDFCLFSAEPITAAAAGATTFNRNEISYTGQPIGLNAEVSSFKDLTTAIKRKAAMFDELIGLTLAYQVIEQVVYAVRSNGSERILKDQIDKIGLQLDLNGSAPISDSPQVQGLRQRIDRETKRVRQSFYPVTRSTTVDYAD